MRAALEARKAAKDALTGAGLTVLFADATPPASGAYTVLTVISAPPVNDWAGQAFSPVRIQADTWELTTSDTAVALKAETARLALERAGWQRVPSGAPPLSWEGEKDAQGRRWWRATADYVREF